ncbi:hypothetical protein TNCV_851701 [Trichonephila clavipes]|nr:hypothetical protein TNCV_851701 [Trichonephila clavipes]
MSMKLTITTAKAWWSGYTSRWMLVLTTMFLKEVTAVRYREEVLEPYVRLFRDAVGPNFILVHDNVRLILSTNFRKGRIIDGEIGQPDPQTSKQINQNKSSILQKHTLVSLKRVIATCNVSLRTIEGLKTALLNE